MRVIFLKFRAGAFKDNNSPCRPRSKNTRMHVRIWSVDEAHVISYNNIIL